MQTEKRFTDLGAKSVKLLHTRNLQTCEKLFVDFKNRKKNFFEVLAFKKTTKLGRGN